MNSNPPRSTRWYTSLYLQVLMAVAVGVVLGYIAPHFAVSLKPLGDGFIRLVKMIIAPVIFCTVTSGIAGVEQPRAGRARWPQGAGLLRRGLDRRAAARPGGRQHRAAGDGFNADPATLDGTAVASFQAQAHARTVVDFLLHIIPDTVGAAFTGGDILQVLFVSIVFGFALALAGERAQPVRRGIEAVGVVVFRVVNLIMRAAPIGALGSMAYTVGQFGISALTHLGGLMLCFYLTSALFVFGVLGAIARYSGFSLLRLLRYIRHELLLVLATSSSEAALPP